MLRRLLVADGFRIADIDPGLRRALVAGSYLLRVTEVWSEDTWIYAHIDIWSAHEADAGGGGQQSWSLRVSTLDIAHWVQLVHSWRPTA